MDTKTFAKVQPVVAGVNGSRLPAGSTLEVNGVHVPHPHAEVNLPGAPDPRVGDTAAVTETLRGEQTALADEVKPKKPTTACAEPVSQVDGAEGSKESPANE